MGKRRSTYGRRRSRSLGALPDNEVCNMIDSSYPPSQRLQLLIQYALEKCISKCAQEISCDIDDSEFSKQASEVQVAIESEIEDQNLYNLAVATTETENVTQSKSSKFNIALYKSAMLKIEEETKQWDQLTATYREELKAEQSFIPSKKVLTLREPVNHNKWKLPDYSNMFEDLAYQDSAISYQVQLLDVAQEKLKSHATVTNAFIDNMKTNIQQHFESMLAVSPRELIKNCF